MQEKETRTKKHSGLKVFFIIVSIILIIFLIGIAVGYNFINSKLNKINYEEIEI